MGKFANRTLLLGISSYSYPWAIGVGSRIPGAPMDAFQLLDRAKALGADRLQLADNCPVHELTGSSWASLLKKADSYGVQLELGMRGLQEKSLLCYLELARQCSSPFLRVVIDRGAYEPGKDQITEIIKNVLPSFRRAGIAIAIENHDRFRAEQLLAILSTFDSEWVGICLDTANSLGADEGLRQVAELLAPYTFNLHYKDYRIERQDHQMGFTVRGVPAGKGQVPAGWLLDLMRRHQQCQSVTLEVWSTPLSDTAATIAREAQWVEAGIQYLRTVL